MQKLNLVMVGHVDHGKSTLIGRLLFDTGSISESKIEEIKKVCLDQGKNMEFSFFIDNLEEERNQGITIDTAQTFFKTENRQYVIIDAPGHIEFIKNMITGASQADAAILLIDIKEGIQEQTRRHASILSLLGLKQVIVAINKMDIINFDQKSFNNIVNEISTFFTSIDINPVEFIPISAFYGDNVVYQSENMLWYDGPTIIEALGFLTTQESKNNKPVRFAIQDIYHNDENIIVGILESGTLYRGDEVIIMPSGKKTKIFKFKEFLKEDIKKIEAGKAIGLILENMENIKRGDILCLSSSDVNCTNNFQVNLFWMDSDSLKEGERLIFKCSTQESICEISKIKKIINSSTMQEKSQANSVEFNDIAKVTIKTEKHILVDDFNKIQELGRFVLERINTCAGGIIIQD